MTKSSDSDTMYAAVRVGCKLGASYEITFADRHPTPTFRSTAPSFSNDVLLKVHAAGLNPIGMLLSFEQIKQLFVSLHGANIIRCCTK